MRIIVVMTVFQIQHLMHCTSADQGSKEHAFFRICMMPVNCVTLTSRTVFVTVSHG